MGRQVFIRNWKSAKQCKLKHKIYTCVEVRAKHQQGSGNYREDHDSYFLVPITWNILKATVWGRTRGIDLSLELRRLMRPKLPGWASHGPCAWWWLWCRNDYMVSCKHQLAKCLWVTSLVLSFRLTQSFLQRVYKTLLFKNSWRFFLNGDF